MIKKDTQLQEDVMNELKWDPRVTSTQINVIANLGIVTLRGSVPHYIEKVYALENTQRVSGVRAVADEIEVNLMGSYERSDEEIAQAALSALQWNYSVPKDVQVSVQKGWITLRGETAWDFQRIAAKDAVSQLLGVRGVTNNITIKPRVVQQADVKTRIEEALKRSAEIEGRDIRVTVKGSKVTLSGNVHSFSQIQDAKHAAWKAPGVTMVEDELKIA